MGVRDSRKGGSLCRLAGAHQAAWPRASGPMVDPRAGLPVAMRPNGGPRSRDGYILHATWLRPSAPMDVRLARRDASFWGSRTPIMPVGYTHHPVRVFPSAGGGDRSTMKDDPVR